MGVLNLFSLDVFHFQTSAMLFLLTGLPSLPLHHLVDSFLLCVVFLLLCVRVGGVGLLVCVPRGLQDLSSPTKDLTRALAVKAPGPNHWTIREFPLLVF